MISPARTHAQISTAEAARSHPAADNMAYGAFTRPRRGDVEAPAEERRRRFERTGIAAAGLCIFLLVVAMFVNAHNRRTAALMATETHSDVVLLACSGNRPRSRATLVDCDATLSNLFRAAQAHDRAVLLGSEAPSMGALDALDELPDGWDIALFDPDACPKTVEPVRRCLWPDGSNCGEVAYTRWALCDSGGAIAGTIAVRGSSAMKVLKGDAAELVVYALIG